MRKLLMVFLLLKLNSVAFSQNGELVQNGGFQDQLITPVLAPFNCDIYGNCSPWGTTTSLLPVLYTTYGTNGIDGIPENVWSAAGTNCEDEFGYCVGTQYNTNHPGAGAYVLIGLTDVGFNHCEISNKLASPLQCGITYRITIQLSRHDKWNGGDIHVVLRFSNDVHWTDPSSTDDLKKWVIESEETGGENNDEWISESFEYTPEACEYEYLLLRAETPFDVDHPIKAVYIDNVSVTPISSPSLICSSTRNCVDFDYSEVHGYANPLNIVGLKNITSATWEIYNSNSQLIRTIGPILNPPPPELP